MKFRGLVFIASYGDGSDSNDEGASKMELEPVQNDINGNGLIGGLESQLAGGPDTGS